MGVEGGITERFPQGGGDWVGVCRLNCSSRGKRDVPEKGNDIGKGPEAGKILIILKGLKGGLND